MTCSDFLWRLFESPLFDPFTATLGFMIPIWVYTYQEIKLGCSSYKRWEDFMTIQGETKSIQLSFVAYWTGILLWLQFVPRTNDQPPHGIPTSLSSFAFLVGEVVSGIILYDAIFFFIHWTMHECKLCGFVGSIHKEHHRLKTNLEAQHVLQHSLIDGSLQVRLNLSILINCVMAMCEF